MARRLGLLGFEPLEVDKVLQAEHEGKTEFDQLYDQTQLSLKQRQEQTEETEDTESEATEEVTGEPDQSNDDVKDDEVPSDTEAALESFMADHRDAVSCHLGMEAIFTQDNAVMAGKYLGQKTLEGLSYLKSLGVQYGPIVIKHVYKGVLFSLEKTLRALVKGSIACQRYIKTRQESFSVYKEKIKKARETLKLLEEQPSPQSDNDPSLESHYANEKVIMALAIGNQVNAIKAIQSAKVFFDNYRQDFIPNVKSNVVMTNRLIANVIHDQTLPPTEFAKEKLTFKGFVKAAVPGYAKEDQLVDTYAFEQLLPGNLRFMGYLPKKGLTEKRDIMTAYSESSMFFGYDQHVKSSITEVNYLSVAEMNELLDLLDGICDAGLTMDKDLGLIDYYRRVIKGNLKSYLNFLFHAQDKVSIQNAMADFIAVKTEMFDKLFVASNITVHDYMARLLNASLTYVKDSIQSQPK